jgi:hypothetical protein
MTEDDVKKCIRDNIYARMGLQPGEDVPTVSQLMRKLEIPHGSAQRIRDGAFPYKAIDVAKIADKLGCDPGDLFRPADVVQIAAVRSSAQAWPFRLVDQALYESLHPEERGAAQIAMRDEVVRLAGERTKHRAA